MNPAMSEPEQRLFQHYLTNATQYAEFGSGGSTCWASRTPTIETIISIESDKNFLETIRPQCLRSDLRWINLGEIRSYGHPKDDSMRHAWPSYSSQDLGSPDLVLVDGRFRVACICHVLHRYPNTRLLVHDFVNRSQYHIVLNFADIVQSVDTLVELRRKHDVSDDLILQTYDTYKFTQE